MAGLKHPPVCWGIDSEGLASGTEMQRDDIHLVTVCPSNDEGKGKAFKSGHDFRKWYNSLNSNTRPKRFYSFTLPYEYGSMLGWELLNINEPHQPWADQPLNLFYINPLNTRRGRIPVIDTRVFFGQILHDKRSSANLKTLGEEMSGHYDVDAHKYDSPMEEAFGLRKPTVEELRLLVRYGIRDSYIAALAGRWIEENILNGWLEGKKVDIEDLVSWGTIAKQYLDLPTLAEYRYTNPETRRRVLGFKNAWNYQIMNAIFAGRSEAFWTGNIGQVYYCDVSSLYPCSIVQSQAMRIKAIEKIPPDHWDRLFGKMTWQSFYEAVGKPYGWIKGTFRTSDDLWGLPTRCASDEDADENGLVIYATGTVHGLYHTLDLEASNAEVLQVEYAMTPVFDDNPDSKFNISADLYEKLLYGKLYTKLDPIEETCLKFTLNAASGKEGEHHHGISTSTNPPAYSTLLAQSHLIMSRIMHRYHRLPHNPIYYTDTDSIFVHDRVEGIIGYLEPYPDLPYQEIEKLPLKIRVKGTTRPEGCIIFRNKMYYQSVEDIGRGLKHSQARGGWKGDPKDYVNIVENKLMTATVHTQVTRKWKTRDKKAAILKTGRWYTMKEQWNLPKIKRIFRADYKRNRTSTGKDPSRADYDSYELHLDDEMRPSQAWQYDQVLDLQETLPERPEMTPINEQEAGPPLVMIVVAK